MAGKFYLQPDDIETIKISETEDKAKEILQKTNKKRLLKKTAASAFGIDLRTDDRYIDELTIVNSGKDVTREFLNISEQASNEKPVGRLSPEQSTERIKAAKDAEIQLGLNTSGSEGEEWEKLRQKITGLQADIAPFRVEFFDRDSFKKFCDNLRANLENLKNICVTGYFSETIRAELESIARNDYYHVRLLSPEFPLYHEKERIWKL